jgi:hypothetical protein
MFLAWSFYGCAASNNHNSIEAAAPAEPLCIVEPAAENDGGEGALRSVEEFIILPHFADDSDCRTRPTEIVFQNVSTRDIMVTGAHVWPQSFSIHNGDTPKKTNAGGFFSLALAYEDNAVEESRGTLNILTEDGCHAYSLTGSTVRDSMISSNTDAIDFGSVTTGARSPTKELRLLVQRAADSVALTVRGFSAGPAPLFEVISPPASAIQPKHCDELVTNVRFNSPNEPGAVEGYLVFETEGRTLDGLQTAYAKVPLFGTAAE